VFKKLTERDVHPIIEYDNVIWGPSYILDNQKIERIQCKATRMIPSISQLSGLPQQNEISKFTVFTML